MLTEKQNPPTQWSEGVAPAHLPGRWWAARCKPNQEKALARDIARSRGGYFLPMYDKTMKSRGRQWRCRVASFPGYLSLFGHESVRLTAMKSNRVTSSYEAEDQQGLVRELVGTHRLLASGLPIEPADLAGSDRGLWLAWRALSP